MKAVHKAPNGKHPLLPCTAQLPQLTTTPRAAHLCTPSVRLRSRLGPHKAETPLPRAARARPRPQPRPQRHPQPRPRPALTKTPVSLSSIQCLGAATRFKCFLGPRAYGTGSVTGRRQARPPQPPLSRPPRAPAPPGPGSGLSPTPLDTAGAAAARGREWMPADGGGERPHRELTMAALRRERAAASGPPLISAGAAARPRGAPCRPGGSTASRARAGGVRVRPTRDRLGAPRGAPLTCCSREVRGVCVWAAPIERPRQGHPSPSSGVMGRVTETVPALAGAMGQPPTL